MKSAAFVGTLLVASLVGLSFFVYYNQESESFGTTVVDESSFANIDEVRTEHFDLSLNLNFDKKIYEGVQTLHMKTNKWGVEKVYLDIDGITVKNVTFSKGRYPLVHTVDSPNPTLGQRLFIKIPKEYFTDEAFTINIEYETSPTAGAVTWLNANQTAGGRLPYMYTQCESIFCRSIAPLQDTPAIKASYSLNFTTPAEIRVRASGNVTHEYTDETTRYTQIEMPIKVESYLLAIAAGNLEERQVGPRTYVITEPEQIDKAAKEFEDLEEFLSKAEFYLTPYVWGIYKLLILPPSFPFGGMENPLLTFASPAIVVGDKSSVDVAVHEICHSWFGNLVTNINWSNFWLNEGFTVFAERKTDSMIYGKDQSLIAAKLENSSMYLDMVGYGLDSNYSSLTPLPNGNHPDDSFSTIPYEKGFQFLFFIESLIGETRMQNFLRSYIGTYEYTSIDSDEFWNFFKNFLIKDMGKKEANKIINQIDFDTWIHKPGLPPVTVNLETKEYNEAINMSDSFMNGSPDPSAKTIYDGFTVNLKGLFLTHMIENVDKVTLDIATQIDSTLKVSEEINGELIYRWLQIAIRSKYLQSPYKSADDFLGSIGRMKFVVPVYEALADVDLTMAKQIYAGHKDFYHPIAQSNIEKVLSKSEYFQSISE